MDMRYRVLFTAGKQPLDFNCPLWRSLPAIYASRGREKNEIPKLLPIRSCFRRVPKRKKRPGGLHLRAALKSRLRVTATVSTSLYQRV